MKKIAVFVELNDQQMNRLKNQVGSWQVIDMSKDNVPYERLSECEIGFGNPPFELLNNQPSLKWIQLESVGFGEYTSLDWQVLATHLKMTNLAGFFALPVAETALAGIMALMRSIDKLVELKQTKTWEGDPIRTNLSLLTGSNVVLVGYGAINQALEKMLVPFQCQITTIRRTSSLDELDEKLTSSDVVVCTAPDTPKTRDMFDAKRLALLPKHAVFANLGRGTIVDEAALAEALNSNKLGGAVLDVTNAEPLGEDNPLWNCPNTLLTQHTGGGTSDELDRKINVFIHNLSNYENGNPLKNIIDFKRGY